jgi:ABC-type cobalamin/Fe3+-siderophores transport system ATPase subunit
VEFILKQSSANKTVITATHGLNIAAQIATKIYVLSEEHKIIAFGKYSNKSRNASPLQLGTLSFGNRQAYKL